MALNRKKREDEKKCSFCKERETKFTVHGGYVRGGGKRCCDNCIIELRKKDKVLMEENSHGMSLGEEQAYRTYGF